MFTTRWRNDCYDTAFSSIPCKPDDADMDKPTRIAVLVGSLRKESFSRKIAHALIARAPKSTACEIVEIGDLPLYNADLEASPPPAWTRFRTAIKNANALLF